MWSFPWGSERPKLALGLPAGVKSPLTDGALDSRDVPGVDARRDERRREAAAAVSHEGAAAGCAQQLGTGTDPARAAGRERDPAVPLQRIERPPQAQDRSCDPR